MSAYGDLPGSDPIDRGLEQPGIRAHQACLSCKKQKRKCSKDLPACALCRRMGRQCNYSDSAPAPTADDFFAMQRKVIELEGRLNASNSPPLDGNDSYPPSAAAGLIPMQEEPRAVSPIIPIDPAIQSFQNRFPAISILDGSSFSYGGVSVPKPSVPIPADVLEILGDSDSVQSVVTEYFATVHLWLPIISKKRMTQNLRNPLWEAGPDLALIFLCMRMIITHPIDGIDASQMPAYLAAKRFLSVMEAYGMCSLQVLQAYLLVAFYEYGQAIYPAAWMTSAACSRYGSMLGISGVVGVASLLPRVTTWTEKEERLRTWWAVLILDRMILVGARGHCLTTFEISKSEYLPTFEDVWDNGSLGTASQEDMSVELEVPVSGFARVCQAAYMLDLAMKQHQPSDRPETQAFSQAIELLHEISRFVAMLFEETKTSGASPAITTATAVCLSALCFLCEPYTCPEHSTIPLPSKEARAMQVTFMEALKNTSGSIVDFADKLVTSPNNDQTVSEHSPLILDAMYCSAANFAWFVRESGEEKYQISLDSVRNGLRWQGARWRCAAEFARILEAQEFTYAIGGPS